MSVPMKSNDPAYWMLESPSIHSQPNVFMSGCYICEDPEFMMMGLPLCRECCICKRNKVNKTETLPINPKAPAYDALGKYGHIAADDEVCDYCGHVCNPWSDPECEFY